MQNIIIAVLVVIALGAGAWYFVSSESGNTDGSLERMTQGESSEEGLDTSSAAEKTGPVATVNGEELTYADLAPIEAQVSAGAGQEAAAADVEQRALDALIAQTLIAQAAADAGATPDEAAVAAEFDRISGQFEDEAGFAEALAAEGISEEQLRGRIERELTSQAYLEAELDLSSISVTDEEIAATYEQIATGEETPPLEEVRGQVEQLLVQQKQQQLIDAHVAELRSSADVEILI